MTAPAQAWKRAAARNVRALTPAEALAAIERINAENRRVKGATIFHEEIRAITGGYNSQSINFHVMRLLGIRAGIIKGSK